MYTLQINKTNWVDDTPADLVIDPDKHTVTIKDCWNGAGEEFVYTYTHNQDDVIGWVYHFTSENGGGKFMVWELEPSYYTCQEAGISREHQNPFVVLGQMVWNLL